MSSTPGHSGRPGADASAGAPWRASPGADASDGWIGTRELPGYRAGSVVAKLADLPGVDAEHLYFDLLLLDEGGRTEETHSGPCPAIPRSLPLDERSRFVRVVAELLRHAPDRARGLSGLGGALSYIRENGVDGPQLVAAAHRLDAVCSESALVAGLSHMLVLMLGEDEARATLRGVIARLTRQHSLRPPSEGDLLEQVACVVRLAGKAHARRCLREATDLDLLPGPELLGV